MDKLRYKLGEISGMELSSFESLLRLTLSLLLKKFHALASSTWTFSPT